MSAADVVVDGHERWLPVPLEDDVDAAALRTVAHVVGEDGSEAEQAAAWLAGLGRLARRTSDAAEQDGVATLLAWTLLPAPGELAPGAVALLRLLPVDPGASRDDALATLVLAPDRRWRDVDVARLDTASGPAWSVCQRPVVERDGERLVQEQRLVAWHRPDLGTVLVLSVWTTDLLEGADAAQPLLELAAGVRWQP